MGIIQNILITILECIDEVLTVVCALSIYDIWKSFREEMKKNDSNS